MSEPYTDKRSIIYLVRHGESRGNVNRRLFSASEDLLTETGQEQALKLGEHFATAGIKWNRIYSSDYPRAIDTAERILSKIPQKDELKVQQDPRLRERFYGDLEGLTYKEGFQMYHEYATRTPNLTLLEFEMPNGETVAATVSRLHSFFQELFEDLDSKSEPENILIVSHSFALVSFMNDLANSKEPKYILNNWNTKTDLRAMRNVSYMKIAVEKKYPLASVAGLINNGKDWLRTLDFLVKHETKHLDGLSIQGTFSKFATETSEAKQFSGCVQQ